MRFEGTKDYVATEDLKVAVNAAITLERPLLVKGEPGTGKTMLAIEVAKSIGAPLIEWHIKSTTKAIQGLYEYDAVMRLRDSQLGDERATDIANYKSRERTHQRLQPQPLEDRWQKVYPPGDVAGGLRHGDIRFQRAQCLKTKLDVISVRAVQLHWQ